MKKLIIGRLLQILSFIGLITPFMYLLLLKKDVYFKTANDTIKISLGVIIGLAYCIILVLKTLNEINRYIKPLIALVIFTLITYLFQSIIKDLFLILLMLVIGYAIFLILMTISDKFIEYGKEYKKTFVREKAKNDYQANVNNFKGNV